MLVGASMAVGQPGIFATVKNFQDGAPSFAFHCDSVKAKVRLNQFFKGASVTVLQDGSEHQFLKSDIFGYRDCNGDAFRLVRNTAYKILHAEVIFLYEEEVIRNKSSETEKVYFFSKIANGPLTPLTIHSLRVSFPGNHSFHDLLNSNFKSDADLLRLDHGTNRYTLIRLYKESLTN